MKVGKIIKIIVTVLVIAGLAYGGWYALQEYEKAQAALGIVICDHETKECQKSMHIHSDVRFDFCGNTNIVLPRETGPLDGLHTHKESNYLHFHDSIDLDYETRADMPDDRLSIGEIIRVFEIDPSDDCGSNAQMKLTITDSMGTREATLEDNWKDGDEIHIMYTN